MRKILLTFLVLGLVLGSGFNTAHSLYAADSSEIEETELEEDDVYDEEDDAYDEEDEDEVEDEVDEEIEEEIEEDIKNYDVFFDEMLSENIYPSFVLYAQMDKSFRSKPDLSVYVEDENAHVKVTIEENELMEKVIYEHDMTEKDDTIYGIAIKWKRKALLEADQPGFVGVSVIVEVNGQVKNRFNKALAYRPVTEAVLGIYDDEDGFINLPHLYACYVNENNPKIDEILGEILEEKEGKSFCGYQGESDKEVLEQVKMIWDYFAGRGTHYSDISAAANDSSKAVTQAVRTFAQCLATDQANCIDGTCMLASILRKIGLRVGIVLVPGHAFLHFGGKPIDEKGINCNDYFLETTMMGSSTFEEALQRGSDEYSEQISKNVDDVFIVYIDEMREKGIMPIGL